MHCGIVLTAVPCAASPGQEGEKLHAYAVEYYIEKMPYTLPSSEYRGARKPLFIGLMQSYRTFSARTVAIFAQHW
jgi:hypothetical protein